MKLLHHGIGKYLAGRPIGPACWPYYDLIVLLEGSLTLESGSRTTHLFARDVVLIPPKVPFQGAIGKEGGEIWVQHFSALREEMPGSFRPGRQLITLRFAAGAEIVGALLRRLHQLHSPRGSDRALRAVLFAAVLRELCHATRNSNPRGGEIPGLLQAAAWAEQHLESAKTLRVVARKAGLCESHFRSLFRKWRNQPAGAWLRELRMTEARRLLLSTGLPTKAIGARVGFGDQVAFNRCFSRVHGMPPGRFRRTHPAPV